MFPKNFWAWDRAWVLVLVAIWSSISFQFFPKSFSASRNLRCSVRDHLPFLTRDWGVFTFDWYGLRKFTDEFTVDALELFIALTSPWVSPKSYSTDFLLGSIVGDVWTEWAFWPFLMFSVGGSVSIEGFGRSFEFVRASFRVRS